MAYVVPSPLVYQQLATAGGVSNATPDLTACLIGPAYNILTYIAGNTASQIKTAATIVTAAMTASVSAGSFTYTFTASPSVIVGDTIMVAGAGAAGAVLQGVVTAVLGLVVTLDTAAITAVTSAIVTKKGSLTNTTITNTFNVPGQVPGQLIDATSISIYLNNAEIETLNTNFHTFSGVNDSYMVPFVGTASITSGTTAVTLVTQSGNLAVGDYITIVGAGTTGANFVARIIAIPTSSSLTLATAAITTVTAAAATKNNITVVSPTTSTLIVETGDDVVISYTNNVGSPSTFSTVVNTVVNAAGVLAELAFNDNLPANVSRTTTTTVIAAQGATSLTLGSVTGLSVGDRIKITSIGGVPGNDFITTVTNIASLVVTVADALTAGAASGSVVIFGNQVNIKTRKSYNNQVLPSFKISAPMSVNYDTSSTGTDGTVLIEVAPELVYGVVISADVYIGYKALRTDLSAAIIDIPDTNTVLGTFGDDTDANPLALAAQIALANTTTGVKCIAIASNDSTGYQAAFDLAQGQRLYAITPLTQDVSILAAAKNHVAQMSTPEMAGWRILLANTAIPNSVTVGTYSPTFLNLNGGNNAIAASAGKYVLTASNATFINDGVVAGDNAYVYNGSTLLGSYTVLTVVSNQQLVLNTTSAVSGVSYYIGRTLSKAQKAAAIIAASQSFGLNRVIHIQPDTVGVNVNGTIKYLPGYYLCAAVAGLIAGFPVQQGFTNIGVAGISDLKNSNFYFTRPQLNSMAEVGTFLFVQETAGSIPYCRHELTTDVSVMEYRELLLVKNWDFLSYFYYDTLKSFMGTWNITPDTISTVRRTLDASSELLKSKKLPKIGPPLLDGQIVTLGQNALNKDTMDCVLKVSVVYPFNFINLYLTI